MMVLATLCASVLIAQSPSKMNPTEAPLLQALDEEITIQVIDVQLKDIVDYLSDMHQVPIVIDHHARDKSAGQLFSANWKGISLRSALNLLLDSNGLGWMVRDEAIVITRRALADQHMVSRVYSCKSLKQQGVTMDSLGDLLSTVVDVPAAPFRESLFVTGNERQHQLVRSLFAQLGSPTAAVVSSTSTTPTAGPQEFRFKQGAKYAVAGRFDFNRDGRADGNVLIETIEAAGGKVAIHLDESGKVDGEWFKKIDVLIVGQPPHESATPATQQAFVQFKQQATQRGATTVPEIIVRVVLNNQLRKAGRLSPFGQDPFGGNSSDNPFAKDPFGADPAGADPFGDAPKDPFGDSPDNPFGDGPSANPFGDGGAPVRDPFGGDEPLVDPFKLKPGSR